MSGGFFRGTNHDQDNRFADKEKKLKAQLKFPDEYDIPVDMTKVKLEVIKPWITKKVTELLGFEDEVVINLIFNMLEKPPVDPKDLQINLTGFLERNTKPFVLSLWKMLVSASRSATGIPDEMLEKKKQEILEKKMERERIDEGRRKREERRKGSSRERDRDRDNHRRDRDRDRDRDSHKDKEREKEKEKEREKEKETVKKEEESEKDKKKRRRWDRTTESPERLPALGPIRENRNSKATNRSRSKSPPKKKHSSPKGEDGNQEPKKSKKKKREKEKDKEKQRSRSPSEPPAPSAQEEDEAILRARALHSLKKKKDDKVKTEEDDTDEV